MTEPFAVRDPQGDIWLRPDNGCYACDVYGPTCPWHHVEWENTSTGERGQMRGRQPALEWSRRVRP